MPEHKNRRRKPDIIKENSTRMLFIDGESSSNEWIVEVNRGQSTFDQFEEMSNDPYMSFGAYPGDDSGWCLTREEAVRLHKWIGERLAENPNEKPHRKKEARDGNKRWQTVQRPVDPS